MKYRLSKYEHYAISFMLDSHIAAYLLVNTRNSGVHYLDAAVCTPWCANKCVKREVATLLPIDRPTVILKKLGARILQSDIADQHIFRQLRPRQRIQSTIRKMLQ